MPKKTTKAKKFDGKKYELARIKNTKKLANDIADEFRDAGYKKVRVVKITEGYGIYVRKRA